MIWNLTDDDSDGDEERGCLMNTVEPIRDIALVMDVADFLKARNERDYLMFMFGIYTGLRISDILKFRVRDVKEKDAVYIREEKTGKEKRFPINSELKPIIQEFIRGKKDYEYLFKSPNFPNKPITRQQAYNILSQAAAAFGLFSAGGRVCQPHPHPPQPDWPFRCALA